MKGITTVAALAIAAGSAVAAPAPKLVARQNINANGTTGESCPSFVRL